jgi:glycosyltransferase involved in cell wall biosynthesis
MMTVHNEADIVGQVIEHLISQGIELVVLDNGSTDGSYEIIQHHIGKGILSVNRMETEYFETESIFGTLHAMVTQYSPDWMLLTASDEFLESPYRGLTLKGAIQLEGERGHNMIQFNNFEFYPTEKDHNSQESDVRKRLRYYSWHDDYQFRCWRMYPGMTAFGTHGHDDKLPDGIPTKVSPNKFILRRYRIRSYEHGLRKIFRDRIPRFSPKERAKGWHVHYDNIRTDRKYFVIDSARLTRYDEDGNWNLTKTFDGSLGAWNPPSATDKISKLESEKIVATDNISKLESHINQLESSLSLRIGRRIPLGRHIRKIFYPNDDLHRHKFFRFLHPA